MRRGPLLPHTYRNRWLRERERSPEIAAIQVGSSITRHYLGETHEVLCCDGAWRYKDQDYPTLYAVICSIVGTKDYKRPNTEETRSLSNWSASRFFALKPRVRAP